MHSEFSTLIFNSHNSSDPLILNKKLKSRPDPNKLGEMKMKLHENTAWSEL